MSVVEGLKHHQCELDSLARTLDEANGPHFEENGR